MKKQPKIISMTPAQPGWTVALNCGTVAEPDLMPECVVAAWALVEHPNGSIYMEGLVPGFAYEEENYYNGAHEYYFEGRSAEAPSCVPTPQPKSEEERPVTSIPPRPTWSGFYYCVIEESEMVTLKHGGYLELVLKVVKGDREGLRIIDRLHLNHAGDAALQERAYKRLADYCHLTGQVQITDSSQLHGIPFWVLLDDKDAWSMPTGQLLDEGQQGRFVHRGEPFRVEVRG